MTNETTYISSENNVRLDVFISMQMNCSRNRSQHLIKNGQVTVNGAVAEKTGYKLETEDIVHVSVAEIEEMDAEPEDIPLNIVYEDSDLCVINKPQGMVVHPAPGHYSGTLVNALLFHVKDLSSIGGVKRPGIVHRIDQMTSGLLVVAKNDYTHESLSDQFKSHTAAREYYAIVNGNLKEDKGTVNEPIGRHPVDRKKMAVVSNGKTAVTHWTVLERYGNYTLIQLKLETGRTHQIRVHMSYIHHPVAGDAVYGSDKNNLGLNGQALHGFRLRFIHPRNGNEMQFEAELPEYFNKALKILRNR